MKSIILLLMAILFMSSGFCWEVNVFDFSTDEGWKYFDDDTGAGTSIAPSGGVLSVPYPNYAAFSWRYIFFDKDSTAFSQGDQDLTGGYVQATLSYTGVAPTFAYFFLAGGGNAGDDLIYIDGASGGSQTFWGTYNNPLTILESPSQTTTATIAFNTDNFGVFGTGPEHRARRGTADSWAASITSVDAVGIALGYFGDPEGATVNIDEFTVTPEPSLLLLSGPLAGFLGWKIRRKTKKIVAKA